MDKGAKMILAGDIGGTKTNLALCTVTPEGLNIKAQSRYASRSFSSLNDIITAFKQEHALASVESACFGIAGPVIEGRCQTTNLPWDVKTSELQEHLGTQKVRILNDLEATAYGMLYLKEDEFVDLNPSGRTVGANRAVVAAGTGLGEAMLYFDAQAYHPIASEGGHSDFAPMDTQQDELLSWLRKRYPAHVSYERILSGPGIYALYAFLSESGFAPQPDEMLQLHEGADKSAMISQCALEGKDPLCIETLRLFSRVYAAEAGNLVLKSMALGGVYIGGGIAPKILPVIREHFMDAFVRKGRFEAMLREVRVRVSLNPETALLGAAHFAADKLG